MSFKPIPNYEGSHVINEEGIVKSLERDVICSNRIIHIKERILKHHKSNNGYYHVSLNSKSIRVHRLLAKLFISNPNNLLQVNHKDGDKSNNKVSNLEWCTGSENIKHGFELGLKSMKGNSHSRNKLFEEDVLKIRELCKTKSCIEISKIYNVSRTCIQDIKSRRNWNHI